MSNTDGAVRLLLDDIQNLLSEFILTDGSVHKLKEWTHTLNLLNPLIVSLRSVHLKFDEYEYKEEDEDEEDEDEEDEDEDNNEP